jgi:hypothetical protein
MVLGIRERTGRSVTPKTDRTAVEDPAQKGKAKKKIKNFLSEQFNLGFPLTSGTSKIRGFLAR